MSTKPTPDKVEKNSQSEQKIADTKHGPKPGVDLPVKGDNQIDANIDKKVDSNLGKNSDKSKDQQKLDASIDKTADSSLGKNTDKSKDQQKLDASIDKKSDSKPGKNTDISKGQQKVDANQDKKVDSNTGKNKDQKGSENTDKKVDSSADKNAKASVIKSAGRNIDKTTSKKDAKPVVKKVASKSMFWLYSFLFNLFLLVGLGFLAIMFFDQKVTLDRISGVQNQTEPEREATVDGLADLQSLSEAFTSQLADANSQIVAQNTELAEASSLVSEHSLELGRLNRELIRTRLRINDTGTAVNQEWLLAEVESLLRLAQQGLVITGDVNSAIALFLASEDILQQINDPAIFSIRQVLAAELLSLRAVTEVDVEKIYLQLGEVNQRIEALGVISGIAEQSVATEEIDITPVEGEPGRTGVLGSVLDKFSEYIVIRRRDDVIQPLLTSDEKVYVKQNVQLQLQQARLALLREQEVIYQSSIAEAAENIELFLIGEGSQKQNILSALAELQETEIIVRVPAVSNTLSALREILVVNNPSETERVRRQEVETEL